MSLLAVANNAGTPDGIGDCVGYNLLVDLPHLNTEERGDIQKEGVVVVGGEPVQRIGP